MLNDVPTGTILREAEACLYKIFRTCVNLYLCNDTYLSECQPWNPFTKYIVIPKRSHIHITELENIPYRSVMGFGKKCNTITIRGTIPPWVMKPVNITSVFVKNITCDILRIDRQLTYYNNENGKPWMTPVFGPAQNMYILGV